MNMDYNELRKEETIYYLILLIFKISINPKINKIRLYLPQEISSR
jgi:hypothetical protein